MPTPERAQHDPVEQLPRSPLAYSERGSFGLPYRALGTLEVMLARGTISVDEYRAGERWHEWFRLAALDPLRAADVARLNGTVWWEGGAVGSAIALRHIRESLDWLGGMSSPACDCCWFVVGLEWSLRRWSQERRNIRVDVASGVLVGALGLLAAKIRA